MLVTPTGAVQVEIPAVVKGSTIVPGTVFVVLNNPALNNCCISFNLKKPVGLVAAVSGVAFLPINPALPLVILAYYLI
jgi:hypothetical protein